MKRIRRTRRIRRIRGIKNITSQLTFKKYVLASTMLAIQNVGTENAAGRLRFGMIEPNVVSSSIKKAAGELGSNQELLATASNRRRIRIIYRIQKKEE